MTRHREPGEKADALIMFGVTGDLARRRLFPALYELEEDGDLGIPVIGVSRSSDDDEALRRRYRACLERCDFARFVPDAKTAPSRTEVAAEARAIVAALESAW